MVISLSNQSSVLKEQKDKHLLQISIYFIRLARNGDLNGHMPLHKGETNVLDFKLLCSKGFTFLPTIKELKFRHKFQFIFPIQITFLWQFFVHGNSYPMRT